MDYQRPAGSVHAARGTGTFPTFSASFGRTFRERGGYDRFFNGGEDDRYLDQAYLERSTSLSARMSLPIFSHPIHRASATFGYDFTRYDNLDAVTVVDPNAPAQRQPEVEDLAGVRLGLAYSNTRANTFSYYSETGRPDLHEPQRLRPRRGGTTSYDIQASVFYSEFIPMPWRGQGRRCGLGGISAGGVARRGPHRGGCPSSKIRASIGSYSGGTAVSEARGVLRGYPAGVFRGRRFGFNVEYRIPLVDVERGLSRCPPTSRTSCWCRSRTGAWRGTET